MAKKKKKEEPKATQFTVYVSAFALSKGILRMKGYQYDPPQDYMMVHVGSVVLALPKHEWSLSFEEAKQQAVELQARVMQQVKDYYKKIKDLSFDEALELSDTEMKALFDHR